MLTGKQLAAYCENVYEGRDEFEREGYSEEKPVDEICVIDGRGRVVKLEVEDDVTDD